MCGIAGQYSINRSRIENLEHNLKVMSDLIAHRGPDDGGIWLEPSKSRGLAHRRLSVIDLSEHGHQPMVSKQGTVIAYNGEIYNHNSIRAELSDIYTFTSQSDTEVILAAYDQVGMKCLDDLRGMFSFAIVDPSNDLLFCARDRFGIKPFYYTVQKGVFYFASEAKALLPFLPKIATNKKAFAEYLTFQYTIGEETLFEGVYQLLPGHALKICRGEIEKWRYWDVDYSIDFDHSAEYFERHVRELLIDSVQQHGVSDVPVGSYVSGGVDSSLIYKLSQGNDSSSPFGFHGRFLEPEGFDESYYAEVAARDAGGELKVVDIGAGDFTDHIADVIYHLDFPVAGPGSFAQYMVSKLASEHVKVVLGGQGGDEIFGGYARYLVAYLEQCLKAAIDGTYKDGNYVVTLESIIPNLGLLREYKPMIRQFWSSGLFDDMDKRYFNLIDRSSDMEDLIDWDALDKSRVFKDFTDVFHGARNAGDDAYFDKMTHFDFKCLLPALLQVEDRMSMAHGIETRVPFLDHKLVEFAATIPADIKFKAGKQKEVLKTTFSNEIPREIIERRDKMGFPVPLNDWMKGELSGFITEKIRALADKKRPYFNQQNLINSIESDNRFSRKVWALLSLELWYEAFHDREAYWLGLAH
ncbi:asparagine synthase (glutamine-hydrolyzing) [Marinobacterium sp. xm-d-530]|uniref:asparagine synthase (glutamine-hydrolyzing) n=1 Tax=Marinobacterium sp. xm-d-530 TaxID=2497747 RepID=UPI00156980D5|nr:asparagine synthase (glutamine-hydrolyzing) [Marinobacterium sp. xm-d-530]NRQ01177.1 Asparagine synthetase [glutamine-hydrolyzing] 1 [Marinobacterium sp. xm-d-530]